MYNLYKHQIDAIDIVLKNNFKSGIIHYATGTGKSLIANQIVNHYHLLNPTHNIIWICEYKFILNQNQHYSFHKNLKIFNFSINKNKYWIDDLNSFTYWKKPCLVIINRAYLTSQLLYTSLKIKFHLLIHDECHTIHNQSTQKFYHWILNQNNNIHCIGFSATPILTIEPLTTIIISFDIIQAMSNQIIAKPIIVSLNTLVNINLFDKFDIISYYLKQSFYKKIIIWCGTIANCEYLFIEWLSYYQKYLKQDVRFDAFIDHSLSDSKANSISFNKKDNNAILFCANKHHEGSDFYNLDGCVFMDGVKNRTDKLFIQCLGRVLRKNINKEYGWFIDFHSTNILQLCDKFVKFTSDKNWKFQTTQLLLTNHFIPVQKSEIIIHNNEQNQIQTKESFSIENIHLYFKKKCPNIPSYQKRLALELQLFDSKNLLPYFQKVYHIVQLFNHTLFITRGSCGSSLVCYLLGISNVDPIKYNIDISRFIHEYRNELPDMDFDFPHFHRDNIFLSIHNESVDKISRISSDIYWKDKSAIRECIRKLGYRKKISKYHLNDFLKTLSQKEISDLTTMYNQLIGQKKSSMLHIGGLIFNHSDDDNHENNKLHNQIYMNVSSLTKTDISNKKIFKIDILSNRGLSIIKDILPDFHDFDVIHTHFDTPICELFAKGNNIGFVLAESVLLKRAMMKYKPTNIEELSFCLAIVRPMANYIRQNDNIDKKECYVYDDDILSFLQMLTNKSLPECDLIRRSIIKGDKSVINDILQCIYAKDIHKHSYYLHVLKRIPEYGFCKAHSISYAMMIYQLAYLKVYENKKFWEAVVNNANSNYKKWVHISEAIHAGVDINDINMKMNNLSIYSQTMKTKNDLLISELNEYEQLKHFGIWSSLFKNKYFDNCYLRNNQNGYFQFRGIIAAYRTPRELKKKKKMGFYLGFDFCSYLDIIVPKMNYHHHCIGIEGVCFLKCDKQNIYESFNCKLF
jgi:hypothetical protein